MDYEKKYKEALDRAKAINEGKTTGNFGETVSEYIFPELKESEDEKIRKELINFVKSRLAGFPQCEKFIAWLEKQGKEVTDPRCKNLEELLTADNIYQMAMNDAMVEEAKAKAVNALSELCIGRLLGLEKHFEPKYRKGDWVQIKRGHVLYIKDVHETYYETVNWIGLSSTREISDIDSISHLWTIQDAKDGDVLASKDGLSILIFRNLDTSTSFSSYYNIQGKGELGWSNECFIPATKEQREQLEKAMADAGYTFDFDKKELRRIEQKPAKWSEEDDKRLVNTTISFLNDYADKGYENAVECIDWLKSLKDRYAWKPSDEQIEFTHHEEDESLEDAVMHQMEDDGDIDDFVRKGIDDIALKYAKLGAKWQKLSGKKELKNIGF